ncbi:MAG TPA: hypothetical protein VNO50_18810 [Pyrinomonadaceae bacterium]|nr:hypothetical protein [Pyrinomonadaceae bacterium]
MKTKSPQVRTSKNGWRHVAILLAFVALISIGATLGFSQVKNQKRVTALQLGDAPEGARVTIVSDSALNDYEAFRRGDRFYVKIPLADFSAATPSFHGNGFEDVRVQKVGDSVIVSFKLQPGATARVDQRSNRLDVIFSAVSATRSVAPVNVAKSYPTSRNRRNDIDSEAAAGPVPPMTSTPVRESRGNDYTEVSPESGSSSYRDAARVPRSNRRNASQTGSTQDSRRSGTAENLASQTKPTASSSIPSPTTAPSSSATSATTLATPAAAGTHNPYGVPVAVTSKTVETSSWDSRIKFLKAWAKLNRSALIIGGLVALALLIGFVLWSRRKRRAPGAAKTPRKDLKKSTAEKVAGRTVVESPAATPVAKPPVPSSPVARPDVWTPQPASAGFAAAGMHESRQADQDREVFEL